MSLISRSRLAILTSLVVVLGLAQAPQAMADAAIDLATLRSSLIEQAPIGSAAYVDPATGSVVLRLAGEASPALKADIAKHSALVQTKQAAPMQPNMLLYGGHGMSPENGGGGCTTGFIASYNGASYVITAGHCLAAVRFWERKHTYLGERESWVLGADGDFGLLKIKGVHMTPRGMINLDTGPRAVGGHLGYVWWQQYLCFLGNVSRIQCGVVTSTDLSVVYPDGVVNGLIETTICATAGDSGGPLYVEQGEGGPLWGVGIHSGSMRIPCWASEYRSAFQPLQEVLDVYPGLALRLGN